MTVLDDAGTIGANTLFGLSAAFTATLVLETGLLPLALLFVKRFVATLLLAASLFVKRLVAGLLLAALLPAALGFVANGSKGRKGDCAVRTPLFVLGFGRVAIGRSKS